MRYFISIGTVSYIYLQFTERKRREPFRFLRKGTNSSLCEGLILAQDERQRHALGMQVERVRCFTGQSQTAEDKMWNLPFGAEQSRESEVNTA